jgi:hypothetical protein
VIYQRNKELRAFVGRLPFTGPKIIRLEIFASVIQSCQGEKQVKCPMFSIRNPNNGTIHSQINAIHVEEYNSKKNTFF